MSKFICDVFSLKPSVAIVTTWRARVYLSLFVLHENVILDCLDSVAPRKSRRDFKTRKDQGRDKGVVHTRRKTFVPIPSRPFCVSMNVRRNRKNKLQLVWITPRLVARAIQSILPFQCPVCQGNRCTPGSGEDMVIKSAETLLSSSLRLA